MSSTILSSLEPAGGPHKERTRKSSLSICAQSSSKYFSIYLLAYGLTIQHGLLIYDIYYLGRAIHVMYNISKRSYHIILGHTTHLFRVIFFFLLHSHQACLWGCSSFHTFCIPIEDTFYYGDMTYKFLFFYLRLVLLAEYVIFLRCGGCILLSGSNMPRLFQQFPR